MKNTVIIKGNKYGITIVLDKEIEFSQLTKDLSTKLDNAENFFDSDKQLAVSFEGRTLSNEEMDELLEVIRNNSKLNIQYVMEQNSELEVTFFDIIQTAHMLDQEELEVKEQNKDEANQERAKLNLTEATFDDSNLDKEFDGNIFNSKSTEGSINNDGLFYRGTLRSGQSLETKNSIIIIGDVNPGANVIAGGNIVVIGSLKGSVTAGSNGNKDAFVMALSMTPMQIQIADIVIRSSEAKKLPRSKKNDAMIATIINDEICVEMVSKSAVHNMNI